MQEVIEHYTSEGSDCHVLLLDASKAFDRIHFVKLFQLLIQRRMCPMAIQLLLQMYTNQRLNVQWNSCTSDSFPCRNGVKQGGVLSPLLFCIYVDELLCRLQGLDVGCRIGNSFAAAFGYADDLTILAPSIPAAETLLRTCEHFAEEYFVQFNASKSQHLICRGRNTNHNEIPLLKLNGDVIPQCDHAVLLGTSIGADCQAKSFQKASSELVSRTNTLLSRFNHCNSAVLFSLFQTYCCSFYASSLWSFESRHFNSFIVSWRKCVKKVWRISQRTHSRLLPHIIAGPDVRLCILARFASFIKACFLSENDIVRDAFELSMSSQSAVARNVRVLLYELRMRLEDVTCASKDLIKRRLMRRFVGEHVIDDHCVGRAIAELCFTRNGVLSLEFGWLEIREVIDMLCVFEPP